MADAHKNFAYSTIRGTNQGDTTNPGTGTTLTVQAGDGTKFPPVPFNATVWPNGVQPLSTNAEIVRVTDIDMDTFTIVRQQESSSSHSVIVGDQIAATITNKTLTDAEAPLTIWSPVHIAGVAQTGLQTLGKTAQIGTNSLYVFPVTVPPNLQFNQILLGNSISLISTTNSSAANTNYSYYGLYSLNARTALNLISSSSFSIKETLSSRSYTISYPVSTATSGWSYATTSYSTSGQMSSFVSGSRMVGLHFGGNLTLTGGHYYVGILSLRSTQNVNSLGLSLAGIVGQPINPINQVAGSLMPFGSASSDWQANNTDITAWWGRIPNGLVTRTALYAGNAIPSTIAITEFGTTGGAGSTATILPAVTFVST
jgi:hypothetical protein